MSILSNFTVVDLIKTRSASVATITGNALKFNVQTAAELHYAPYVQVLVNPKDKPSASARMTHRMPSLSPNRRIGRSTPSKSAPPLWLT